MSQKLDGASGYLRTFAIVFASLLAFVGLFNVAVDPYSLFDSGQVTRVNDRKGQPGEHIYALKTLGSLRSRATSLVLGSSRAQIGLDPQHSAWSGAVAYNLGVPGADMYEVNRYFEQVHHGQPLQRVVLAIEYSMFDGSGRELDGDSFVRHTDGSGRLAFYGRLVSTIFSADTLMASVSTLGRSAFRRPLLYRRDGLLLWERYKQSKLEQMGGHRPVFRRLVEVMRSTHRTPDAGNLRYARALDAYRAFLRTAHADGIELHVVLSPEHAWLAEARDALDSSSPADAWRRDLVRINREEQQRAGLPGFPLWDFASFSTPNLEPVPADGDAETRMRWYWEASHYKVELGDIVLARVLAGARIADEIGPDFGVLLDEANLEAHLEAARLRRDAWAASRPQSVALLHALMD